MVTGSCSAGRGGSSNQWLRIHVSQSAAAVGVVMRILAMGSDAVGRGEIIRIMGL